VFAIQVQDSLPEDTLFGRSVKESGFAVPLVVLGFAAMWVLPTVSALVAGDIFSAEDRYRTWSSILTRSRSRTEIFAGKVIVALGCSVLAAAALGGASIIAGLAGVGSQPLIDLSGALTTPRSALAEVVLAWCTVLPPVVAFSGLALLLSIWSRSSTAGVGLPVVIALGLQLAQYVNGSDFARQLNITSAFSAWHGLVNEHPYYRPVAEGVVISLACFVLCTGAGYRMFRMRDMT
jgi:ABC-2 type transport system permease protein